MIFTAHPSRVILSVCTSHSGGRDYPDICRGSPNYLLACIISKLWPIIGEIFASNWRVPHYNALARGNPIVGACRVCAPVEHSLIIIAVVAIVVSSGVVFAIYHCCSCCVVFWRLCSQVEIRAILFISKHIWPTDRRQPVVQKPRSHASQYWFVDFPSLIFDYKPASLWWHVIAVVRSCSAAGICSLLCAVNAAKCGTCKLSHKRRL